MTEAPANGRNGNGDKSPEEAELSARLGRLDRRLAEFQNREIKTDQNSSESGDGAARASAMALGFRLSSELVAGVAVGGLLGWSFDHWLSTSPFGLIVFVLLGFTAGVVNVVRSAGAGRGSPGS